MLGSLAIPREGISAFSGVLFGIAWFILIDGNVYQNAFHHDDPSIEVWYYVPGIIATLALLMQNLVNLESLNPSSWLFEDHVSTRVRVWLFCSFVLSFGSIVASVWLMVGVFLPRGSQWPGTAMVLQSAIIFISSLSMMWAKSEDESGEYSHL